MVVNKKRSKKLSVAVSTHCTSYGTSKRMQLPDFPLPKYLFDALKKGLKENETNVVMCKDYMKSVKNLLRIEEVKPEHYLVLFKIFLFLEDYEEHINADKHRIKNYVIKNIDKDGCFHIKVLTLEYDEHFLDVDDMVLIEEVDSKEKYKGKVVDIFEEIVTVQLQSKKNEEDWNTLRKKPVNIKFVPSNFPIKCGHHALNTIYKYKLVHLLFPKLEASSYSLPSGDFDWIQKSVAENPEQKQAVLNILNKSAYPAPYILFGPPGTGKTLVLVEAVLQIWKTSLDNVLICASSNTAVDEITKRLLKIIPAKDIYRMYSRCRRSVPNEVQPCSNIIGTEVVFIPNEIFLLKRIVIASLITCTRLTALNLRCDHFSYIFIDEASQVVEPEALIPFTLAIDKEQQDNATLQAQIVVAGDHYQLAPVVKSRLIQHVYGKSFIERLMKCEPYQRVNGKYDQRYITKLIWNYRSLQPILHVPNKLFYDGELKSLKTLSTSKNVVRWPELKNKTFPIIFCSTNGKEERNECLSVCNSEEIVVVTYYVTKLLRTKIGSYSIEETDIGIITPFRRQQVLIEQALKNANINNVSVGTVHTFQGREKKVIIFSTVRSRHFVRNGKAHLGFLSNPKIFNVGITRAQILLIIVGNPGILCTDQCWQELYMYCRKNNACIVVNVDDIKVEMQSK